MSHKWFSRHVQKQNIHLYDGLNKHEKLLLACSLMLDKYIAAEHYTRMCVKGFFNTIIWRCSLSCRVAAIIKRRIGLVRKWCSLDIRVWALGQSFSFPEQLLQT